MNRRLVRLAPAAGLAVVATAVLGGPVHTRAATYATCTVFTDTGADAPTPPLGKGQSDDLDITGVAFGLSDDATTLKTYLTIANLDTTLPKGSTATDYQVLWNVGSTTYATDAEVTLNPAGQPTITYADGQVTTVDTAAGSDTQFVQNPQSTPVGTFTPGANGTIEIDVPVKDVGSPKVGDILTQTQGDTASGAGLLFQGAEFIADQDNGTDYTVGTLSGATC